MSQLLIGALASILTASMLATLGAASPQNGSGNGNAASAAIECPDDVGFSSGAILWYGCYDSKEEAEAAIDEQETQAIEDAEARARGFCPETCTENDEIPCQGFADFSASTATGQALPLPGSPNKWSVRVTLDIDSTFFCRCDT